MPRREDIVAEARNWLGTPWIDEGRMKGLAVDCIGLPVGVAHALDLLDPTIRFQGVGRLPSDDGQLENVLRAYLDPVPLDCIAPGDVALMITPKSKYPMHLGILGDYAAGGLSLIHATLDVRKNGRMGEVVEHRLDDKWRKRIVSAWRFRGLE